MAQEPGQSHGVRCAKGRGQSGGLGFEENVMKRLFTNQRIVKGNQQGVKRPRAGSSRALTSPTWQRAASRMPLDRAGPLPKCRLAGQESPSALAIWSPEDKEQGRLDNAVQVRPLGAGWGSTCSGVP